MSYSKMPSFVERVNAKRIAQGLEPIPPIVLPPRKPGVFEIREFISNIHKTLAPYIGSWHSPEGLKRLETICREMGFQGTTEEFTTIFYSIHSDSLVRDQLLDAPN
jgi:hypothetical protein